MRPCDGFFFFLRSVKLEVSAHLAWVYRHTFGIEALERPCMLDLIFYQLSYLWVDLIWSDFVYFKIGFSKDHIVMT